MTRSIRIFFVADLHGSAVCFRKFVNAAKAYRADVLLVGGDIAAKTMTPIFPDDGGWRTTVEGERRSSRTPETLEDGLRDAATIPYRTTPEVWTELIAHRPEADRVFEALALEELRRWLDWARVRIGSDPTRLLLGLGNDDLTSMEAAIAEDALAELTDLDLIPLGDRYSMLTLPFSNPTPWQTRRELSEEEIARRIESMVGRVGSLDCAIFNFHVPPAGTPLDLAPKLDPDLTKRMSPGGEAEMVHVGSTAVRDALDRYQPLLGLHGHIHESRGTTRLGRTLSINPGSAYTEGTLLGAVIDLEGGAVRSTVLTSG